MKRLIVLFFVAFAVTATCYGQKMPTDDEKARIGTFVKLFPEVFNVNIASIEAKSVADVITNAFTSFYIVPEISFSNVTDAAEIAELQRMRENLVFLLTNPPSWEQLVNLQTKQKLTPPTAPVFAGDASAKKYYNSNNADGNRNMSGKNPKLIESETSNDYIKNDIPPKN